MPTDISTISRFCETVEVVPDSNWLKPTLTLLVAPLRSQTLISPVPRVRLQTFKYTDIEMG